MQFMKYCFDSVFIISIRASNVFTEIVDFTRLWKSLYQRENKIFLIKSQIFNYFLIFNAIE